LSNLILDLITILISIILISLLACLFLVLKIRLIECHPQVARIADSVLLDFLPQLLHHGCRVDAVFQQISLLFLLLLLTVVHLHVGFLKTEVRVVSLNDPPEVITETYQGLV
jgi:hypothetical protein